MRSQKIRNKEPRPFKRNGTDQGWSGGNKKDFLPPKKSLPVVKKPGAEEAGVNPPLPSTETPPADH